MKLESESSEGHDRDDALKVKVIDDKAIIVEFRIYLEQNFCLSDWDDCKQLGEEHFTGMHTMAMEKFFIPTGLFK